MTAVHAEKDRIERGVQKLFALVADGLPAATEAFVRHDRDAAALLVAADPVIDALQLDIEGLAQHLLVERNSLSDDDIRLLVAVVRIVPELERSADLVEHIALRTGAITHDLPDDVRDLIARMGDLASAMWRSAAEAWAARDARYVDFLQQSDDAIDDLHVQLTERLAQLPLKPPQAIELGLVARFFERLGDHAVNVTRRLTFLQPTLTPA